MLNTEVAGATESVAYQSPFASKMLKYIEQNEAILDDPDLQVESYLDKWMGEDDRLYFARLCEARLGGSRADKFLTTVFSAFGSDYNPGRPELEFSKHAERFLRHYEELILERIKTFSNYRQFRNYPEHVYNGVMDGIAYGLGEPRELKGNRKSVDQRLHFFIVYPEHLTGRAVLSLRRGKVLVKSREEITAREHKNGYRSIDEAKSAKTKIIGPDGLERGVARHVKADRSLRDLCLEILTTVSESTKGRSDGLLVRLMSLIESKHEDIQNWVSFHIWMRIRHSLSREIDRKQGEGSIHGSLTKYVSASGARRHPLEDDAMFDSIALGMDECDDAMGGGQEYMPVPLRIRFREDTEEERKETADTARSIMLDSLSDTKSLSDYIIEQLRTSGKAKSAERADKLEAVMELALRQIHELFQPEHERSRRFFNATDKGLRYHQKGSRIIIHYDGERELDKLISPSLLVQEVRDTAQIKLKIHNLKRSGMHMASIPKRMRDDRKLGEIAERLTVDLAFVKRTLNQPRKTVKMLASMKFSAKTRKEIKNYFGHWWVEMLPIMLEVYEDYPVRARRDLFAILGVHNYIAQGHGWGWNVNRVSGISNTRMYYMALGIDLDLSDDPEHCDIVQREKLHQETLRRKK